MTKSPFPYPGGKAQRCDFITDSIPRHTRYVEVFGGSAGVLFSKSPSAVEVYNDRDGLIVNFFEVLRDSTEDLVAWLDRTPYSRELHKRYAREVFGDDPTPGDAVDRAGKFFYLRFTQHGADYSGKAGFKLGKKSNRPEYSPSHGYRRKVDALDDFADRLADVTIEALDWSDVFDNYDASCAFFFADPPYYGTESSYRHGEGFDHAAFHDAIAGLDGDVMVTYADLPPCFEADDDLYFQSRDRSHLIEPSNRDDDTDEWVITNYDPTSITRHAEVDQSGLSEY